MRALTDEQERALAVAGPRVAVAAGAGSGKTTMLVEAIWRDVERDGVAVEDVFAATYNRAAAGHLLSRLHERFSDPDHGRPPGRAALDPSAGWIGTFHGLCARIVREHPFAAGADPGFAELDEARSAALLDGALDEALAATDHPGFRDLLAHSGTSRPVRDAARAVFDRLRAAGIEAPRLHVPAAPTVSEAEWHRIDVALDRVAAHPDLDDRHAAGLAEGRLLVEARVPTLECPKINLVAKQGVKQLIAEANAVLKTAWEALVAGDARAQLLGFAAFLERFATAYATAKRERGALDFEDLQLRARRVLRGPHPYRFRRVYVDEFQDANAVQNEILDALDAERTLVVGDGCQAIYGFRHASAEHFLERVGQGAGDGLRANHRSQPPLMEALNALLAHAMDGQPAFAPLAAAAGDHPGPPVREAPIELVTVVSDQGATGRGEEAEVIAEMVARFVHDDGYRPRDIAVLFRALTQVEPYRAAIEAAGLPVHLVAGRGFFTHDQVADALALLALVENPWDEPALLRVAASPYVAASDAALVSLRRDAGPSGALWPAVPGVAELAVLPALVEALRPLLHQRGLPGLADAVVTARGYDLAVLGLADGERRHANLRRLVRLAEDFAAVRGPDLRGFLRQMDAVADDPRLDPGEATLVDPDLDAVRLATIHSVKGQQFPVVVIADASHRIPGDRSLVLVDRAGVAGIRAQRAGGQSADVLGYPGLKEAAAREAADEERRLLYVAATRAMRHLAVVGRAERQGGGPDTPYSIVQAALEGDPAAREEHLSARPVPERLELPVPPEATPAPDPSSAPPIDVTGVAGRRLSFSALTAHAVCARRYMLEWELRLPRPGRSVSVPGAGSSGTEVGTLVHVALADHHWAGPAPGAGWAAPLADRLGLEVPPEALARAEALVADLATSDLAARIGRGQAVAERTFAMALDGVLLTGAIDLEVREPAGGVLLVDWKTHTLAGARPESVMDEYRLQQSLYGLAALRAGAPRVELRWVFLEALPAPQVRIVAAADQDALVDEVRRHLTGLDRSDRPATAVTAQPFCAGCPGLEMYCPVSET